MKKIVTSLVGPVPASVAIVVSGVGKVFVGEMVESGKIHLVFCRFLYTHIIFDPVNIFVLPTTFAILMNTHH